MPRMSLAKLSTDALKKELQRRLEALPKLIAQRDELNRRIAEIEGVAVAEKPIVPAGKPVPPARKPITPAKRRTSRAKKPIPQAPKPTVPAEEPTPQAEKPIPPAKKLVPRKKRTPSTNAITLPAALAQVMAGKESVSVPEAVEGVLALGYTSTSKNFSKLLGMTLAADERFERVSRGHYRVKG